MLPARLHALWLSTQRFLAFIVPRSYVLGLAAGLVIGTGYETFFAGASQTEAQTSIVTQVERRTIATSVKAAGKVTFASEQQLRFNQRGTVAKVTAKEGDKVTRGQIIAELDTKSVMADIRSAQLSIGASALQLQQLQSDKQKTLTDAENSVRETERQLEQAQNNLAISQKKLPNDLAAAERDVKEREASLEQAKLDLEKQRSTEMQSLAGTAQDALSTGESIIDSFYSILTRSQGARPAQGNYQLEINHLLYNDPDLAQRVIFAYLDAVNAANAMRSRYGLNLKSERNAGTLASALNDAQTLALATSTLAERSYSLLQGASVDTTSFPATELSSLRSSAISNRTRASDLIGTVETAQANLAAASSGLGVPSVTLKQKVDAVTSAENALLDAQENYSILSEQNPSDLAEMKNSVQKMQEDVVSKQQQLGSTATSTDINIRLRQNDVAQRASTLEKARQTLETYKLKAPFDGILTHMDYKVGDNLLDTGDTEHAVIQNPDFIIVTIPLDQVDVVRVRREMAATITLDAIPGQSFQGTIDAIDPTPIEQSGVVSYNVSVKLPTPAGLTVLSGMTATVDIETSRKENALAVPNLAISRTANGRATVSKQDGTSVPVETGVTDGRYTEILSGVSEGDAVVSMNVTAQTSSTAANQQQMFRLGGGGGGGGFGGGGFGGAGAVRIQTR